MNVKILLFWKDTLEPLWNFILTLMEGTVQTVDVKTFVLLKGKFNFQYRYYPNLSHCLSIDHLIRNSDSRIVFLKWVALIVVFLKASIKKGSIEVSHTCTKEKYRLLNLILQNTYKWNFQYYELCIHNNTISYFQSILLVWLANDLTVSNLIFLPWVFQKSTTTCDLPCDLCEIYL